MRGEGASVTETDRRKRGHGSGRWRVWAPGTAGSKARWGLGKEVAEIAAEAGGGDRRCVGRGLGE